MKARDLLNAVERYAAAKHRTPEDLIREVPDDKFKLMVLAVATLFKQLKAEAVRRGIWDELKGLKPNDKQRPKGRHALSCPAYGNYQPPYEECNCGEEKA